MTSKRSEGMKAREVIFLFSLHDWLDKHEVAKFVFLIFVTAVTVLLIARLPEFYELVGVGWLGYWFLGRFAYLRAMLSQAKEE